MLIYDYDGLWLIIIRYKVDNVTSQPSAISLDEIKYHFESCEMEDVREILMWRFFALVLKKKHPKRGRAICVEIRVNWSEIVWIVGVTQKSSSPHNRFLKLSYLGDAFWLSTPWNLRGFGLFLCPFQLGQWAHHHDSVSDQKRWQVHHPRAEPLPSGLRKSMRSRRKK